MFLVGAVRDRGCFFVKSLVIPRRAGFGDCAENELAMAIVASITYGCYQDR